MRFTASMIFVPTLVAKICFAGLSIEIPKLDESLVEASIEILESCYTDRFSTVGIAGPSVGSIIKRISLRDTVIPATLINEASRVVPHDPVELMLRYKLQVFVVTVIDPNTLIKTLGQVRNSTWWNHMASFFLIDSAETKNGCSNAYEMLWEAWKMNLLNANFMCLHEKRGTLINTFNPYTSEAPGPWQQENTYKGMNDHVWTLFAREYDKDESLCDRLDFDKTVDLGGYEIRAAVEDMESWWYPDPNKKATNDDRLLNITAQLLMDSVNATWKLSLYPEYDLQRKDEEGNRIGPEREVLSGVSDIFLVILGASTSTKDAGTYPFYQAQLAVVTQYRGDMSQLDKLISVLDKSSRYGVVGVLTITLLFLKFWLRRPLTSALLDIVLIICNAGLQTIPLNVAPRNYLTGLFIFVVTIQGIYSGQLASLLTKRIRLPTVDSFDDLAQSDHIIYAQKFWLSFFDETTFQGRRHQISSVYCIKYVLSDPKVACVASKVAYTSQAARNNLHLSRSVMDGIWGGYLIRADWPLEGRINTVYERLAAGGIQNLLYAREVQSETNMLEAYERRDQEPELKVMTLGHLGFAFVILGIGLACATVTFIVELAIYGKWIARFRKRIRKRVGLTK